MILTLLAVSLNDQALSRPITARFDTGGGTIGRADHSTMALPDPERFISRKQAEIAFIGGGFTIRNVGAANPITVAQRALAAGETATLRHGDEVRIGGYLLRAECRPGASARAAGGDVAATVVSGSAAAARAAPLAQPARPAGAAGFSPDFAPGIAPRAAPLPSAAFSPSPPLASDNPFADLLGPAAPMPVGAPSPPAASSDPFADLMPPPAGITASLGGVAAPAPAGAAKLPDDFDPFASSSPGSAAAAAARGAAAHAPSSPAAAFDSWGADAGAASPASPSASPADPFADLFGDGGAGRAGAPSIDQDFGLGAGAAPGDALARFVGEPVGPAPLAGAGAGSALPTDPLLLFGEAAAARPVPAAAPRGEGGPVALPDDVPAVHGAYAPPRVAMPGGAAAPAAVRAEGGSASPARPAAAAPAPAPTPAVPPFPSPPRPSRPAPATPVAAAHPDANAADTAALWQAFCEGAGIELPAPGGEGEALMRHIGRVLRSAVEGTLQLAAVRASTKHEMRAAVTQIRSTMNNPLKFSPDAVSGLAQLLSPPQRGFMDGAAAMDDVMLDLVGHSIGTVSGMRAAIEGMLERFDPAALEAKLGAGSRLANLLPMNRKARLWELYLQHHRQIRDEAEEDFHTVFGRAFVAAYEQQVERLEQQQRQRQRSRR